MNDKPKRFACEICGVTIDETPMHRVNEYGVPGIWRCRKHLTKDQEERLGDEVLNIVDVIDKKGTQ